MKMEKPLRGQECGFQMPDIDKIMRYERGEMDPDETLGFFQDGPDKGWVWQLQGHYGRTAAQLLSMGLIHDKKGR